MEAIEGAEVANLVSWPQVPSIQGSQKGTIIFNRSGPTYFRARELSDPPYLGPAQNRTLR